jgi:hypothetical protein
MIPAEVARQRLKEAEVNLRCAKAAALRDEVLPFLRITAMPRAGVFREGLESSTVGALELLDEAVAKAEEALVLLEGPER